MYVCRNGVSYGEGRKREFKGIEKERKEKVSVEWVYINQRHILKAAIIFVTDYELSLDSDPTILQSYASVLLWLVSYSYRVHCAFPINPHNTNLIDLKKLSLDKLKRCQPNSNKFKTFKYQVTWELKTMVKKQDNKTTNLEKKK